MNFFSRLEKKRDSEIVEHLKIGILFSVLRSFDCTRIFPYIWIDKSGNRTFGLLNNQHQGIRTRPQGIHSFIFFFMLLWTEHVPNEQKRTKFYLKYVMCRKIFWVCSGYVCAIVQNWFYANMKMENYKTNILPTKWMFSIAK